MSAPTDHLTFEVLVEDHIDERLAGHAGCRYHSPAHTHQQAAALVHALLGTPASINQHQPRSWSTATAGGRRTVTVTPLPRTLPAGPQVRQ